MLEDAIKAQQETFLTLAAKVAVLHEAAEECRERYRKMTGAQADPFVEKKPVYQAPPAPKYNAPLPQVAQQQQQQQAVPQQQQQQQFQFQPQQQQQAQQQPAAAAAQPFSFSATPSFNFSF